MMKSSFLLAINYCIFACIAIIFNIGIQDLVTRFYSDHKAMDLSGRNIEIGSYDPSTISYVDISDNVIPNQDIVLLI